MIILSNEQKLSTVVVKPETITEGDYIVREVSDQDGVIFAACQVVAIKRTLERYGFKIENPGTLIEDSAPDEIMITVKIDGDLLKYC